MQHQVSHRGYLFFTMREHNSRDGRTCVMIQWNIFHVKLISYLIIYVNIFFSRIFDFLIFYNVADCKTEFLSSIKYFIEKSNREKKGRNERMRKRDTFERNIIEFIGKPSGLLRDCATYVTKRKLPLSAHTIMIHRKNNGSFHLFKYFFKKILFRLSKRYSLQSGLFLKSTSHTFFCNLSFIQFLTSV